MKELNILINLLQHVEVKGKENLNNLLASIQIVEQMIAVEQAKQKKEGVDSDDT